VAEPFTVSLYFFTSLPNSSLHAEGFSGTAGRTSSLTHTGTQFSTKDRDNDRCTCKCAQLASGGTQLPSTSYPPSQSVWWNMSVHPLVNVQKCISLSLHCQYKVTAGLQLHIWVLHFMGWNLIHTDFLLELWHIPCSRLVVWGLRSIQPEWHILPQLLQCGSLQRHQVVLLEGSKSDGYHDDHDGAPGKLLTASRGQGARLSSRLWWTKWTISRKWYIWGGNCYPTVGGFSSSTSWSGARVDAQQRTVV